MQVKCPMLSIGYEAFASCRVGATAPKPTNTSLHLLRLTFGGMSAKLHICLHFFGLYILFERTN